MEITWKVISGEGEGGEWGKGTGNKHKWQLQNRQGEVNNSIGNGEAREVICKPMDMNKGGDAGGNGDTGQRETKGRKMGQL